MKIQGYKLGTEVKWTDEETGGFRAGIVRSRYYDPDATEIDGEMIEINVLAQSPTYKVEVKEDHEIIIIIDHNKVTRHHQNTHT